MNVAEWIIVAILSITLMVFLIVGIVLMIKFLSISDELKRTALKSQDIAGNVNDVVTNVKGMTSIGGSIEMLVDKYINPKIKESIKDRKEKENDRREEK